MIVVYEQFGVALNLGLGNWTTIRKVNAVAPKKSPDDPDVLQYCLAFDFNQPGHAIPYPSEEERDSHWVRIVGLLRQQNNPTGIVGATKLPPDIMAGVERR